MAQYMFHKPSYNGFFVLRYQKGKQIHSFQNICFALQFFKYLFLCYLKKFELKTQGFVKNCTNWMTTVCTAKYKIQFNLKNLD